LIRRPKYNTLFKDIDLDTTAEEVHNGYFSADKKGVLKDTSGSTLADEDAYNLIMRDKESLLSFDTKLRFISLTRPYVRVGIIPMCSRYVP